MERTSEIEMSNSDTGNAPKSAKSWNLASSQGSFEASPEQPETMRTLMFTLRVSLSLRPSRQNSPNQGTALLQISYYCNEFTNETTRERPVIIEPEGKQENAGDEAFSMSTEKEQLIFKATQAETINLREDEHVESDGFAFGTLVPYMPSWGF
jgi:hypothetical protein